jgi:hypothetical protein
MSAKKQELEFTIDDDGKITVKVVGASGPECLEMTKAIEEALGIVVDRQKTSEFYQQPAREKTEIDRDRGGQGGGQS